jgi:hypothetical protein
VPSDARPPSGSQPLGGAEPKPPGAVGASGASAELRDVRDPLSFAASARRGGALALAAIATAALGALAFLVALLEAFDETRQEGANEAASGLGVPTSAPFAFRAAWVPIDRAIADLALVAVALVAAFAFLRARRSARSGSASYIARFVVLAAVGAALLVAWLVADESGLATAPTTARAAAILLLRVPAALLLAGGGWRAFTLAIAPSPRAPRA